MIPTKEKQKEKKKLQRQFEELETNISRLKQEKNKSELALANQEIYSDKLKFQEAEKKYNAIVLELTASEQEYEKIFEIIMEMGDN